MSCQLVIIIELCEHQSREQDCKLAEFTLPLKMVLYFSEIMGHCSWSIEADSHEPFHNVDGWQFHLHISNHDGWNDVHTANPGSSCYSTE